MTTNTDTPSQGIGLREAAAKFETLLADPSDNQNDEPAAASENADAEQAEATADADELEETPPSDTADAADDEEGASEDDAPAEDEEDPSDDADLMERTFTVKIDGKEETIPLKEALQGYQRTADYTRKSQALAEERKAFQAEADAIKLERQQYAQLLPVLVEQIKSSMDKEPDWERLIADDPVEYVRQERLWRERQDRLAAAQEEQKRLADLEAAERQKAIAGAITSAATELVKAMPDWRNPQKWNADRDRIMAYGQKIGFKPEELKQTYDHRAILTLYKAMRYDDLMAKRPTATPQTGPKPVRPGSKAQAERRPVSEVTRAKQRLAKTGRVKDAAALFERLL